MQYDCLVVSPDARLWLLPDAQGWCLPSVECGPGWLPNAVAEIQDHFRARYGMEVVVLRELFREFGGSAVCELEALGLSSMSATEGVWHYAADAADALRDPPHRAAMARWRVD